MKRLIMALACAGAFQGAALAAESELHQAVARDYAQNLAPLFDYFHRNPELSFMETKTAARLAQELRAAGFQVTERVGGTGVVAIMKNGPGPMVMMRADMDGLPVEEKSGLPNASKVTQKDREGNLFPVMHACGHDVHITSLVGTAHQMAARKSQWSGTLMLIGQPAEERVGGAIAMMKDNLWQRFGKPDYALAFHVSSPHELGKLEVLEGSPYSGADTVEVEIHGVGAHGASPHTGKDPVVIGAQIVMGLQALVSRDLPPREPGLITVGSFHAGTKANIISDKAVLQMTVRSESPAARKLLLDGIRRVALNTARAAGVAEDKLPTVREVDDPAPPTVNDIPLTRRLKQVWLEKMGADIMDAEAPRLGMGAEDFPGFTTSPYIPSVYFRVGGTPRAALDAAKAGGPPVPGHHSGIFKITPEQSVRTGVEATVIALMDLMKKG
ncbi:amidohydrolase [Pseudoduganella namucuonensis]|uniref:Hippurate hydrolase n=1 Tax=Pseudoduganella namucuonensis TaxID=1035707 RepID=A0A1I7M2D0_9BURK|nr:amidohydrolase [Pseudoduganella namucuonensis]SFV16094.1 hippurate hydrolase [Pseudoduganella namucuonensis]